MLSVESTVDRLSTRVWVSVEAAVFSVDGIREWQWIGIAATSVGVSGADSGSAAAICMSVSVEAALLSVESTVDRLSTRVSVSVEVAVFSVDGIRKWQWIG